MRNRTFLFLILGLALAGGLVGGATALELSNSKTHVSWIHAQQSTPLLWIVDGCALLILIGSGIYGAAVSGPSKSMYYENERQLAALSLTVEELSDTNIEYASRVRALEDAGDNWHTGFEAEASRLTEQAFLALSDNIEANAKQLEAINLALRYQRAEAKALRAALKSGGLPPADLETEAPPPLDVPSRPSKAIHPQPMPTKVEAEQNDELGSDVVHDDKSAPVEAAVNVKTQPASAPDLSAAASASPSPVASSRKYSYEDSDLNDEIKVAAADTNADGKSVVLTPSAVQDPTVNAGTTVVEMVDFDVVTPEVPRELNGVTTDVPEAGASGRAAEFRRIKERQRSGSIFRQKRP